MENMKAIKKKEIPGYPGYYATTDGNIIGPSGKTLKGSLTCGYLRATLTDTNGKRVCDGVHRLIAMTFIPNPDNLKVINHINNIHTDNRVENLEWTTYSDNMKHAVGLKHKKALHAQAVEVIYKNTNIHKTYPSITAAAEATGWSFEGVRKNLNKKRDDIEFWRSHDNDINYIYFAQIPVESVEYLLTRLVYNKNKIDIFDLGVRLKEDGYVTAEILKAVENLRDRRIIDIKLGKVEATCKLKQYFEDYYGAFVIDAPLYS